MARVLEPPEPRLLRKKVRTREGEKTMQDKSTDEKIRKAKSYSTPQVQSYTSKQLLDVLGPAQGYGASFGGDDTNPNPF